MKVEVWVPVVAGENSAAGVSFRVEKTVNLQSGLPRRGEYVMFPDDDGERSRPILVEKVLHYLWPSATPVVVTEQVVLTELERALLAENGWRPRSWGAPV